jgi:YegS/Rv2252/BmrU family lipid kinase
MSKLPLVIINPESAGGATKKAWPGIASDLATHFGAFEVAFTKGRGDGSKIASEAARAGHSLIIACGGDGTINEAANGILESGIDAELGILPSGTGGDFRKTLEIPTRAADAALALRKGKTEKMDVGRVTFLDHSGKEEARYFLGVSSFGLGGEVIERVKEDDSSWTNALPGIAAYATATLKAKLSTANKQVLVQLDEKETLSLTVANLCVANAKYFGGGMYIAPDAKLNDGKFDVVCIGDLSTSKVLTNAHKLYLGTHFGIEGVNHALASRVVARPVNREEVIKLEVDGELPGRLPATFEIVPKALRVRVPA